MKVAVCFKCGSEDVKTIGFHDFGSNNIEIEEVQCNICHFKTEIPLQNKTKQMRDQIKILEGEK